MLCIGAYCVETTNPGLRCPSYDQHSDPNRSASSRVQTTERIRNVQATTLSTSIPLNKARHGMLRFEAHAMV